MGGVGVGGDVRFGMGEWSWYLGLDLGCRSLRRRWSCLRGRPGWRLSRRRFGLGLP